MKTQVAKQRKQIIINKKNATNWIENGENEKREYMHVNFASVS